jgi:CheY-like chemotaxis protein
LGLAITSKLVALMGGVCGVTSRLGIGSTFWFTVRFVAHKHSARPEDAYSGSGGGNVKVLVAVDNTSQRQALSEVLVGAGIAVDTAKSSRIALEMLREEAEQGRPFSTAFVDRFMPEMDGLDFANAVVRDHTIRTQVVLLAGMRDGPDLRGAIAAGLCRVLFKPIHSQDLMASLEESPECPPVEVESESVRFERARPFETVSLGRVLLAEDNLVNQKVAVAMLSGAGYEVDVVSDGLSAVGACVDSFYDVIVMDCQMPGLNGYQATASIRAREAGIRRVPIVALTASARPEDQERCISAGMDSYLSKPVSKVELLAAVRASIRLASIQTPSAVVPRPVSVA